MKTTAQIETDRPEALQTIADMDKGAAITAACKAVAGIAPKASIEMVDYNGRLGVRGPFRQYAELRFNLLADDGDEAADTLVPTDSGKDNATGSLARFAPNSVSIIRERTFITPLKS